MSFIQIIKVFFVVNRLLLAIYLCSSVIQCLSLPCTSFTYDKGICTNTYQNCKFFSQAVSREVECAVQCDINLNCAYYIMDTSTSDNCKLCLNSACGNQVKPAWFDQATLNNPCVMRNEETFVIAELIGPNGYMLFNKAGAPEIFYRSGGFDNTYLTAVYDIKMWFRTTFDKGILFYAHATSNARAAIVIDYMALYMFGRKVIYDVKGGNTAGDVSKLMTINTYNDDQWHYVTANKDRFYNKLCVDSECLEETIAGPHNDAANIEEKFYFGAGPSDEANRVQANIGLTDNFVGYLANVTLSGNPIGKPLKCINVTEPKFN